MEKYDGMNRVDAVVAPACVINKKAKAKWPKLLVINTIVASVLALTIFCGKLLPIKNYNYFVDSIKQIVCFDMLEYIADKVKA